MSSNKFNIPTVIVVFGATGDLMARKIAPALFNLFIKGELPKMFRVIGVSRRNWNHDSFRQHVEAILQNHVDRLDKKARPSDASPDGDPPTSLDEALRAGAGAAVIPQFIRYFFYHQGHFEERKDYDGLAREMGLVDTEWKVCSNKLFYLAVPPENYKTILTFLHESHLTDPCPPSLRSGAGRRACSPEEGWTRILVEKPFGKDLPTARELDKLLGTLFKEEQIYRIDHYLGKEMLQNIITFRFANNFLEESWSGDFIERIDIRLLESIGVEKRGAFYDGLGAFRDVGQNHLLQMLALVTMENPRAFTAHAIRANRARTLSTLQIPSFEEVRRGTVRAQYSGYQAIPGVSKGSIRETYFKVRATLVSPRWQGVPVYLSSGKKFPHAVKDITVTFRHPTPCLCPPGDHVQNKVIFSLEPEEQITIQFSAKVPGLAMKTRERSFDFLYRSREARTQYVEEYEKLLLDCILGDQTLFVSTPEVDSMWRFTDRVVEAWEKNAVPLKTYPPNSFAISEELTSEEVSSIKYQVSGKTNQTVGVIGLGKMGASIAKQLSEKGWNVVAYNRTQSIYETLERYSIQGTKSIAEFVETLPRPRVIWVMLPAGKVTGEVLEGREGKDGLVGLLDKGDIVVDAGNSFYKDTIRRAALLKKKGVKFVDVGISGGPTGARRGASLMIGGTRETFESLKRLFQSIAAPRGVAFFPGVGAGHFVKMIHNGIEYGMMQALAEGFTVLKKAPYKLDLTRVADVYNHGSVIESRLITWIQEAFAVYGENLRGVSGTVSHTGEGKWTVETAKELKLKLKIIEEALKFRIGSEKNPSYMGKVLSALRNRFGGHAAR